MKTSSLTLLVSPTTAWHLATSPRTPTRLYSYNNEPRRTDQNTPEDPLMPTYGRPRQFAVDYMKTVDMDDQAPGAIIESEEDLAKKEEMLKWIPDHFDAAKLEQCVEEVTLPEKDSELYESLMGIWGVKDLKSKFDYEFDPLDPDDVDPNYRPSILEETTLEANPVDEDGIEVGFDPLLGYSTAIDTRTIMGFPDSYIVDERTRDKLPKQFEEGDPEIAFNDDFRKIRQETTAAMMDTYKDEFLGDDLDIPRLAKKWHGYPEQVYLRPQEELHPFPKAKEDFNKMEPYEARKLAVQYARAKNAPWMPAELSYKHHAEQRAPYEKVGTLVGTYRKGECDPILVEQIQPALDILGSCVKLLSIEEMVFRFQYFGLMKNKHGMACWTETLLQDCGVEPTGVVFETGFRKRDSPYDYGSGWDGPIASAVLS